MSENTASEQFGLTPLIPGTIPNRSPSMSELVELKLMCRDAKRDLESVYCGIKTLNLGDDFDNVAEIMDNAGRLIDQISIFCLRSFKRMDEKKGRRSQ